MARTKLLVLAGTRPEVIKLAPVVLLATQDYADSFQVHLCLTGQHETMAHDALSLFNIRPQTDLRIMKAGQTLNEIGTAVFSLLPPLLSDVSPDIVMVQGDTTTAALGAVAAFHQRLPVAHVEAGMRSHDLESPFPEEANRRIISVLARYHFCPTELAKSHLEREGVPSERMFVTGNTVVDALEWIRTHRHLPEAHEVVPGLSRPFVLVTAHRRESFGPGFERICRALRTCASRFPSVRFVYPVHLNPNVRRPVHALLEGLPNVILISPVNYVSLLGLLNQCEFVLTDSGGLQEEAPSFGKYCIVMRDVTERVESIRLSLSELVGTDEEGIVAAVSRQLTNPKPVSMNANPYGDGKAAERILEKLR